MSKGAWKAKMPGETVKELQNMWKVTMKIKMVVLLKKGVGVITVKW